MEVKVKDKTFWFVFFELFCGFFVSVAYLGHWGLFIRREGEGGGTINYASESSKIETFADRNSDSTVHLLIDTFLLGGFAPLVFRSQLYSYGKSLGKTLILVLMIVVAVFYIGGGVMVFLEYDGSEMMMRGIFAVAAGVLAIVDMVFLIK